VTSEAGPPAVPAGWYPDPSGSAQWRRWDGAAWADATMPYGPPPPEAAWVLREQLTWGSLRTIAPISLLSPAAAAIVIASQTSEYGPLRSWLRQFVNDQLHGRAAPPMPTVPSSTIAVVTDYAVWIAVIIGLLSWMRFSSASIRVASLARYPQHHNPSRASASLFVPLLGPFVASSSTRASLPAGHEARRLLDVGWMWVLVGQVALIGVVTVVWSTPSLLAAWAVAALCAVSWIAAAVELPQGLAAIAQDHESLGVRLAPRRS